MVSLYFCLNFVLVYMSNVHESNDLPFLFGTRPLFGVGVPSSNAPDRFSGLEEAPLLLQFPGPKAEEWIHRGFLMAQLSVGL